MINKTPTLIVAALAASLLPLAAQSQVTLLIDLGATAAIDDVTNSPLHQELGPLASSFTNWNTVGAATTGSLIAADSGVTSATYDIVTGRATGGIITWDAETGGLTNHTLGTSPTYTTGVYSGNSVGTDGLFHTQGSAASPGVLGLVIGGLAAGEYNVYVIADNTNSIANNQTQTLGAASINAGHPGAATFSNVATGEVLNYGDGNSVPYEDADTSSWVLGVDYDILTVSLSEGENLLVNSIGYEGNGEVRPFMNAVMITAVPEPSTYAAISGLLVLGFVVARRRKIKTAK